jgi:hypothetical protein
MGKIAGKDINHQEQLLTRIRWMTLNKGVLRNEKENAV